MGNRCNVWGWKLLTAMCAKIDDIPNVHYNFLSNIEIDNVNLRTVIEKVIYCIDSHVMSLKCEYTCNSWPLSCLYRTR